MYSLIYPSKYLLHIFPIQTTSYTVKDLLLYVRVPNLNNGNK